MGLIAWARARRRRGASHEAPRLAVDVRTPSIHALRCACEALGWTALAETRAAGLGWAAVVRDPALASAALDALPLNALAPCAPALLDAVCEDATAVREALKAMPEVQAVGMARAAGLAFFGAAETSVGRSRARTWEVARRLLPVPDEGARPVGLDCLLASLPATEWHALYHVLPVGDALEYLDTRGMHLGVEARLEKMRGR